MKKVWECKIGEIDENALPPGADFPMRRAIEAAYFALTGKEPKFIFSGWGGELNEIQRAIVESDNPDRESERSE